MISEFRKDVLAGLSRPQKSLPPKYFYDARGSRLFERICRLPEYYVTRAELAITRRHLRDIARFAGRGVTAAFNLNLLARINRELGGDFDLRRWRHYAFYNASRGRVEMHVASLESQSVNVGAHRFSFGRGETIHTENSYKYSIDEF